MFIDRERELAFLQRAWDSERAELLVVYGRRRVGKTALLRAFCAERPHTFWVASLSAEALLRQGVTQALWSTTHPDRPDPGFTYATWARVFEAMGDLAATQRHVMVLDEFPYLVQAEGSVPSVLQQVWDERLQHTRLLLILCGSHIGMMEQEVLLYRAPLYGRRTGQIRLRPLPLRAATAFFPRYTPVEQIEAYAVLGGIPAYLGQFTDRAPLLTNIDQQLLAMDSYLYLEPHFLLREELRDPHNYFGILQAIAQGRTRLNEIAQATGLGRQPVSRYLAVLQDLQVIERRVPVTETQPEKSRRGLYRLRDPFLRFWFRFVFPQASLLERGQTAPVLAQIEAELPGFIGPLFEELCQEWVLEQGGTAPWRFLPSRVGAWWGQDAEIDVMAVSDQGVLVGECKWTARPVGTNVLDDLKRKAYPLVQAGGWPTVVYLLCARAGFTPTLEAQAREEGILLVGPEQLLASPEP